MIRVGVAGWCKAQAEVIDGVNLLEVQRTFYQPPQPETARRWRDKAPKRFTFTVKTWQLVTHPASSPTYSRTSRELDEDEKPKAGYVQDTDVVEEGWEATVEIARILDAPLAVLQLPPSFDPTEANREKLVDFAVSRAADVDLAVEVRGSWEPEHVREVTEDAHVVHATDPFAMPSQTPEKLYLRLHGRPADERNYNYTYTDEDLEELLDRVADAQDAWVVFNNHTMFDDAQRFRRRAREAGLDAV